MPGPLQGVKVVEFTEIIAGPLGGMLLADMGAEVTKVEPPWGDPWRLTQSFSPTESRQFLAYNRGKRSLTLDLTSSDAAQILSRLIPQADVVLVNYRPDVAVKLGVDYESLRALNPRLIYCENTAFGRSGPDAERPGYDIIIQAMSGLMASEGKMLDGAPLHIWSSPMVDTAAGLCLAWCVCGALYSREKTGRGQKIETTLMGTALMLLGSRLVQVESLDQASRNDTVEALSTLREAGIPYRELLEFHQEEHPPTSGTIYYRTYQTRNGAIAVGCLSDPLRRRLLEVLNLEDIRFDADYDPQSPASLAFNAELIREAEHLFGGKTSGEWLELLGKRGIPAGPVRFVEELFDDPQIAANDLMVDLEHRDAGKIKMAGLLASFSDTPLQATAPPALGQHSDAVLGELGFTAEQIEAWREDGVIR